MRAALAGATLLAATLLAAAACSRRPAASTFTPAGGGPSAAGGGEASDAAGPAGGYVMPPFGTNVHIDMTSWVPADAAQAQAVNTDKNYELAFLYAEYKGGQDQSWENYVSPVMRTAVAAVAAGTGRHHRVFRGDDPVLRHERHP